MGIRVFFFFFFFHFFLLKYKYKSLQQKVGYGDETFCHHMSLFHH